MHYSYDFAQHVNFPFDAQQTGPAYFKTARKCGIFGVTCDGKAEQVNYLINEAENPGKGADCTLSLVHHYLENYGCAEDNLVLHADNCTRQNKLQFSICYGEANTKLHKFQSCLLVIRSLPQTDFLVCSRNDLEDQVWTLLLTFAELCMSPLVRGRTNARS